MLMRVVPSIIRFFKRCTSDHRTCCWISKELEHINYILKDIGVEIGEVLPKVFHVMNIQSWGFEVSLAEETIFNASMLYHILVRNHSCIKVVNLNVFLLSNKFKKILLDALEYKTSLKKIKIDGNGIIDYDVIWLSVSKCRHLINISIENVFISPNI